MNTLKITEIFSSIQGESTYAGERCAFVRLTGCNLRCSYCDTTYAYDGGSAMSIDEIVRSVVAFDVPLVEITGGEPLMQENTPKLAQALIDAGLSVLIETNGSMDISVLPNEVVKIIDYKAPSSGEMSSFLASNLIAMDAKDELKIVIGSKGDYFWAKKFISEHTIEGTVIFSPSWEKVSPQQLTEWIVEDHLPVRLGLQIHKVIWDKDTQGV